MRKSKTLAKWRQDELARMSVMGLPNPAFVAQAARAGYDAIWLDLEHRTMTDREVQLLMAFFRVYDIDCILRPPTKEKTRLYRYLEDGATGLLVPHVSTPEQAADLVQSVKFPPVGDRGLDAAGFDSDFQAYPADDYVKWALEETFLIVQIETPLAIENVDAIAAVEGVDALFLGPGDLGLRYRQAGDDGTLLEEAYQKVAEAAARHDKQWSAPGLSEEDLGKRYQQGARLLSLSGEFSFVANALKETATKFDELES